MLYVTHETSASTSGIATRLLAEKLNPGTTSNMFPIRMKKKNAARSGRNLGASGPSIGSAMFSRTNWTPSSINSWNLPGMTFGLRNAKKNSARTINVVKTSRNAMKLKQSVNPKILKAEPQQPAAFAHSRSARSSAGSTPSSARSPRRRPNSGLSSSRRSRTADVAAMIDPSVSSQNTPRMRGQRSRTARTRAAANSARSAVTYSG